MTILLLVTVVVVGVVAILVPGDWMMFYLTILMDLQTAFEILKYMVLDWNWRSQLLP